MKRLLIGLYALTIPFQADFKDICGSRWLDRATVAECESGMNPQAKSFDGGMGLGQVTGPKTWPWYQQMGWVPKNSTPLQIRPAIQGIHGHMGYLERRLQRQDHAANGAYNAGEQNIRRAIRLAEEAGLEGPDCWLVTLPQVTRNSHYTLNYIRHIREVRAKYHREFE